MEHEKESGDRINDERIEILFTDGGGEGDPRVDCPVVFGGQGEPIEGYTPGCGGRELSEDPDNVTPFRDTSKTAGLVVIILCTAAAAAMAAGVFVIRFIYGV